MKEKERDRVGQRDRKKVGRYMFVRERNIRQERERERERDKFRGIEREIQITGG